MRSVDLAFGRSGLRISVPEDVHIIEPRPIARLADPRGSIREAFRRPAFGRPLTECAPPGTTVAVSVCDITRPFPAALVLPVLLEELPGREVIVCVATGTHRACTDAELKAMLGDEVLAAVTVVQHDADAADRHVPVCRIPESDVVASIDRTFMEADVRVTLGFVEPHFFAGFSGGPKMVAPGLADLATVAELHSAQRIGDRRATWGVLQGNPVHDGVRAIAHEARVAFALDVTLDRRHDITAVFAGALADEHAAACQQARRSAMVGVPTPCDVVVTTNSGYPLDQNLYQSIKGLRAAAGITRPGGTIILVAECEDGLPDHGRYSDLLQKAGSPERFLELLASGAIHERDQWQVQVQAGIQASIRVLAYAPGVADDALRQAWMTPVHDPAEALAMALHEAGPGARAAILPDGPQTIAYLVDQ